MPSVDPILEEIHAIRAAIAEESDYDAAKIAAEARKRQEASGRGGVTLPPRPVTNDKKRAS